MLLAFGVYAHIHPMSLPPILSVSLNDAVLTVSVKLWLRGLGDCTFNLTFNTQNNVYASLLFTRIHDELVKRMREIRRESYAQGWRDAKSKHARKKTDTDWFDSSLP
jgi:hypothetical protein